MSSLDLPLLTIAPDKITESFLEALLEPEDTVYRKSKLKTPLKLEGPVDVTSQRLCPIRLLVNEEPQCDPNAPHTENISVYDLQRWLYPTIPGNCY
jgi:hypothetical protein